MKILDEKLIKSLVAELVERGELGRDFEHHPGWMTAREIADWLTSKHDLRCVDDQDIDDDLIEFWERGSEERRLRPAKYPDRTTCRLLWGTPSLVRQSDGKVELIKKEQSLDMECVDDLLPDNDKRHVFVSHSLRDLHLAARVRYTLAHRYGIRAWLSEEQVAQNGNLVECVGAALQSCLWMLVVLTRYSLVSAWVDTETQDYAHLSAADGKTRKGLVFLADASDKQLMDLLESWNRSDRRLVEEAYLDPLLIAFARAETSDHRCETYRDNALMLLGQMKDERFRLGLYPTRPSLWTGHERFKGFDDAIRGLEGVKQCWTSVSTSKRQPAVMI